MKLFNQAQLAEINRVAAKSKTLAQSSKPINTKSITNDLKAISDKVCEYFKDSEAILITSKDQLHDYVTELISVGIAGIDTETTGLDRIHDTIVGSSLYYPGGVECYIPNKHLIPIFDQPYKGQLSYEDVQDELKRIVESRTKLVFANADFDLAMIYKDYKVDLESVCYFDVILAWRCLREHERDNTLKGLYNKYCLKGEGDPMKFSDFFSPQLFPYCKPEVAKLYAADDAKITYAVFLYELPFITQDDPHCKRNHLEGISDIVWNVEFPMIPVCQDMHRVGIYLDKYVSNKLLLRYEEMLSEEEAKLAHLVDELLEKADFATLAKKPFASGKSFNPKSVIHAKYLIYSLLKVPQGKSAGTGKDVLADLNMPVTNQILKVRSLNVLISTFVRKLPNATTPDSRIHAQFKSIGADTGRMSSADPNVQNIPSHAQDIRHMFRATASHKEILECEADSEYISIDIPKLNRVMSGDNFIPVYSLSPGMPVKLLNDGKEVELVVDHMEDSNQDSTICHVVFGLQRTRTQIDSIC